MRQGLHNSSKCKCLLALEDNEREERCCYQVADRSALLMTLSDIHSYTGIPVSTLMRSLPKWTRWELIEKYPITAREVPRREPLTDRGRQMAYRERSVWGYRLAARGRNWLRDYGHICLDIFRFQSEMERFRAQNAILEQDDDNSIPTMRLQRVDHDSMSREFAC